MTGELGSGVVRGGTSKKSHAVARKFLLTCYCKLVNRGVNPSDDRPSSLETQSWRQNDGTSVPLMGISVPEQFAPLPEDQPTGPDGSFCLFPSIR